MGSLSLSEPVKTLECPNCKKYITSDASVCRFCNSPISPEMVEAGIEKEDEVIRKFQIAFYRTALISGIVFFLIGAGLLTQFFLSLYLTGAGSFFYWSPVLVALGTGEIIYAFYGFYKERPRRKKT